MSNEPVLVGLLILAVAVAVFAALAETALLRASKVRVEALAADGDRRARRLEHLQERLPRVLNAVLLVALLSQIGAAALAGLLAQERFGSLGVTISSVALTFVLFVYGEAIPKTYAVRHAERVGRVLAVPIGTVEWLLRPVVSVLVWFSDLQAPGKGVKTGPTITEDELKLLAHSAAREGEITDDDRRLIERAFVVGDRHADDVMVPRTEIVGVRAGTPAAEALVIAREAGHRRLPVYKEDLDQIIGVVRVRDMTEGTGSVDRHMISPLFVPESRRVLSILREMQERRTHMAIVVDEHGGTAGLITVEDVVEELFGDIGADPGGEPIRRSGATWSVDGAVPVEDLGAFIEDDELLEGEWNTAAGLVMGLAGRVVEAGERVRVGEWDAEVVATDGLRIVEILFRPASDR